MVNSVSATQAPAQNRVGAMDKLTQEQLAHPGYYAVSPIKGLYEVKEPEYKKKGGFFRFLGKLIITAVVVGGAAIGIRKGLMKNYEVQEKLGEKARFGAKLKNSFAKYTDVLYDSTIGKVKAMIDDYQVKHPKQGASQASTTTTGNQASGSAPSQPGNAGNTTQPTENKA